jgi:cytochrome c-type biogenesis protein
VIGVIGGVLLITIGVLEITGWWNTFVTWLQVHFPASDSLF